MNTRFTPSKREFSYLFLFLIGQVILWLIPVCPVLAEQAPFKFEISQLNSAVPGTYVSVPVIKTSGSNLLHGFDMLFAYDTTGLEYVGASGGVLYDLPGAFEWEYFTYRVGPTENCNETCPPGMVRVVSLADLENGPHHPKNWVIPDNTIMFTLNFLVKDRPESDCEFFGVRFYWTDCSENGIAFGPFEIVALGVADSVYEFNGMNITDHEMRFPGCYGFPTGCIDTTSANEPVRNSDYVNGGVHIQCLEPYADRGDLNLNGIGYETSDWDLYVDYFLNDESKFIIDQIAQIEASDVKGDNIPLSVDDFVYLSRVMDTIIDPWPLAPIMSIDSSIGLLALLETDSSYIVRSELGIPSGALLLKFDTPGWNTESYSINLNNEINHLDLNENLFGNQLNILISGRRDLVGDQAEIDSVTLPAGPIDLIEILFTDSPPVLDTAYASGYFGGNIMLFVADVPNFPPGFDQYPQALINEPYGKFEYDFLAYDPNNPPDLIEYHLISGPGEIDPETGFWQYLPLCEPPGTSHIIEICASDLSHPCPQSEPILHAVVQLLFSNPEPILGDTDFSGEIDLVDILLLIGHVYGTDPLPYPEMGDADSNGELNLLDILNLIEFTYYDGPAPQCP